MIIQQLKMSANVEIEIQIEIDPIIINNIFCVLVNYGEIFSTFLNIMSPQFCG